MTDEIKATIHFLTNDSTPEDRYVALCTKYLNTCRHKLYIVGTSRYIAYICLVVCMYNSYVLSLISVAAASAYHLGLFGNDFSGRYYPPDASLIGLGLNPFLFWADPTRLIRRCKVLAAPLASKSGCSADWSRATFAHPRPQVATIPPSRSQTSFPTESHSAHTRVKDRDISTPPTHHQRASQGCLILASIAS